MSRRLFFSCAPYKRSYCGFRCIHFHIGNSLHTRPYSLLLPLLCSIQLNLQIQRLLFFYCCCCIPLYLTLLDHLLVLCHPGTLRGQNTDRTKRVCYFIHPFIHSLRAESAAEWICVSSYSHFKCYPHNGRRVWVGWEWNFNPKHFATLDSIEKLSSRIGLAKESLGNDLQDQF